MLKEFKQFLMRGNVMDLAVAVVIGAAFTAIVTSLVDDIITPAILNPALKIAGAENIAQLSWGPLKYGSFLSSVINFVIVGFVLFILIKLVNKAQELGKKQEAETAEEAPAIPEPTNEEKLLAEIRDLLKDK